MKKLTCAEAFLQCICKNISLNIKCLLLIILTACSFSKLTAQAFTCTSLIYQVAGPNASNSTLYSYDVNTGVRTTIAALGFQANAIGYNTIDNLIWGYDQTNNKVVSINASGASTSYTIPNLPATSYNVGTVFGNGYLFLYSTLASRYFVVDINPLRFLTYLKLVNPVAAFILDTPTYGTGLSGTIDISDIVYNTTDGLLYGVINPGAANQYKIITLNPLTASTTLSSTQVSGSGFQQEGTGYGSIFKDVNANRLYVFANAQGSYYQVDISTKTATLLSTPGIAINNDGASCPTASLSVSITGNVFNDVNANTIIDGAETGTTASTNLYVYLVNSLGIVVDSATVQPNGTYTLAGVGNTSYTIELSAYQYPLAIDIEVTPIVNIPPNGWVPTGENGASNTGSGDGKPNGVLSVTVVASDKTQQNFGITQAGYIYVHKKALNESASINFPFTVSGGTTTVAPFILNDQPAQLRVKDIGSSQNGRLWAIDETTNRLYYRNVNSNAWVATSITDANRVDGDINGKAVYINTSGTVFSTDGTVTTQISTIAAFSGSADIGSGWDELPYITKNGIIYRYSGAGTVWNTITDQSATYTSYAIDVNPLTSNAYVAVKNGSNTVSVLLVTAAGIVSNIGAPAGLSTTAPRDIAINDKGEIFLSALSTSWFVFKYNGSWSVKEDASFDVSNLTGGVGGELWITMNSGGQNFGQPTIPYYNIFTRATDGTNIYYIDDERVRTTAGNSMLIPVIPGNYTITEGVSSGWDLQTITLNDPTNNSTSNAAAGTATINVVAGEIVNAVFQNGELNAFVMTNSCSATYLETFGTGSVGSFGSLVAGQTSYHFLNNSIRAEDGYCKIVSTAFPDFNSWQASPFYDHTSGNGTGRMYAVNAGYDKGEFFRRRFTGVVNGATYAFSAWAANLTPGASNIRPNIKFQVLDHNTKTVIGTYNTGDINTATSQWNQYSFTFTATSTDIDLILSNNSIGGAGNDLAIDDISFAMMPPSALATTIVNGGCSSTGSITVTSPVGASFEYSKDGTTWQSSTIFSNLVPAVYTIYSRFVSATSCVTPKIDTVKAAICGNVYNDTNGLTDNIVNGTPTNLSGTLIAVLYDNITGKVVDTAYITSSGTYTLRAIPGNNSSIYLTSTTATIGQTAIPTITMTANYVNTGENIGTGAGNDGTVNSILPLGVVSAGITNANFGVTTALSLGNQIWYDEDIDGKKDPGEIGFASLEATGLSSVTVYLYQDNNRDSIADGAAIKSMIVPASTGIYGFSNLAPGNYIVGVLLPSEYSGTKLLSTSLNPNNDIDNDNNGIVYMAPIGMLREVRTNSITLSVGGEPGLNSNPTIDIGFALAILPVKILDFNALPKENMVQLNWKVAGEINVDYYEIERSVDGIHFNKIAKQKATSIQGIKDYTANDNSVNLNAAIILYRLKMIDKDGSYSYSNIITIKHKENAEVKVYPNPATSYISLQLYADKKERALIAIIDATGKTLLTKEVILDKGSNNILINNLSKLVTGIYNLQVKTADKNFNQSIVIYK